MHSHRFMWNYSLDEQACACGVTATEAGLCVACGEAPDVCRTLAGYRWHAAYLRDHVNARQAVAA